jgi:hypothetical protein
LITSLVTGLAIAAGVGALFVLSRRLRTRPPVPREMAAARYRKLAPIVLTAMVAFGAILVVSLIAAALF